MIQLLKCTSHKHGDPLDTPTSVHVKKLDRTGNKHWEAETRGSLGLHGQTI